MGPILNVPPITKNETGRKKQKKEWETTQDKQSKKTQAGPHGSNGRI